MEKQNEQQPYGTPQQRKEIYKGAMDLLGVERFVCWAIIFAGRLRDDFFEWSKNTDLPNELKAENFVTSRFPEFASQKPTKPIKSISSGWWYINDRSSRINALNAAIAMCDEQILLNQNPNPIV